MGRSDYCVESLVRGGHSIFTFRFRHVVWRQSIFGKWEGSEWDLVCASGGVFGQVFSVVLLRAVRSRGRMLGRTHGQCNSVNEQVG